MSLIEPATISRLGFRDIRAPAGPLLPAGFMRQARDGSVIRWGAADMPGPPHVVSPGRPAPITIAVSPVRPGHAVMVEYRANGGPVRQAMALPVPGAHTTNERLFRALLPGQSSGLVDFLPVLRFAGQPISPRLTEFDRLPQLSGGRRRSTASRPHRRHRTRTRAHQRRQVPSWRASRAGTGIPDCSGPAPSVSAKR